LHLAEPYGLIAYHIWDDPHINWHWHTGADQCIIVSLQTMALTAVSHLYLQIAEALRMRIAAGEFVPDNKLPTVRQLAQQWSCTPGTVSRAYQLLAREGLVVTRRGQGTTVAPHPIEPPHQAWTWPTLVNRAEQFLLQAVQAGHGPAATETALSLAAMRYEALKKDPPRAAPPVEIQQARQLRFYGSHDLVVELLARRLQEGEPPVALHRTYTGSLGGLIALAEGRASLAGVHLWDETTNSYNLPFIARVLPGRALIVLTLAHRNLGLILAAGNPQGIQGVEDIARPGLRFVNRQPGSGTRVWLEAHLRSQEVDPAGVSGYDRAVATHLAVASAIASGEADLGVGLYAAAASYGLDFIPLTKEQYDLVISEEIWDQPRVLALRMAVQSSHLARSVTALGGYDTAATGNTVRLP
jgi:molybdate-binding protein/DNA-binding transcriptional regulator YhcF (GntR family)